jgi:glycosyltransferase involved in cell wall biosynthesis
MDAPLDILYLMEDTDLSGGVRIQLAQADALIARGHRVTIATRGLPLTWRRSSAEWIYVDDFGAVDAAAFDFVIGTFWTTVPFAWRIAGKRAVHLCQGYEGSFSHYAEMKSAIEATYRLAIPKLVVTPYLADVCRRFHDEVFYIGQIVDGVFFRSSKPPDNEPLRLLLAGASQIDIKGIEIGYGAVAHARYLGAELSLVRVSPWAPSRGEPLDDVAEFHVALDTEKMAQLLHSCDLFIGPSRKEEGFGLPAAEALAAGLPAVLTRIPSYLSFSPEQDHALFGDEDDPVQLGEQLERLAHDPPLRRQLSRRGREVAAGFTAEKVAIAMETYLLDRRERLQVIA